MITHPTANITKIASTPFDLAIVGGGVYGIAVALEAARRGLRPILLERHDFAGATSWNSLRILHGGLRYLQTLDLARFRQSVNERQWFCQHFPELIRPLPCLMPLYSRGLKRPAPLHAALWLNDQLARHRNHDVQPHLHLPASRLLSADETIKWFPRVVRRGLQGGALWYDAVMVNSQRVLIEMLRWACACGATARNYVNVKQVITGVPNRHTLVAIDTRTGQPITVQARTVINCAGPAVANLLEQTLDTPPALFTPSLAFNLLLDRPAFSRAAVAVQAPAVGAPVHFVQPWRGRLLAGTVHVPWHARNNSRPHPTPAQIADFLNDLNAAIPGLDLTAIDVRRVYAGLLPAAHPADATLANRPVIHDHANDRHAAPGFVTVVGVKFTTARHVAEHALRCAWAHLGQLPDYQPRTQRPVNHPRLDLTCPEQLFRHDDAFTRYELTRIVREEAVAHLDDLLLRRTDWASDASHEHELTQRISDLLTAADCPLPRAASQ
ncbi:FAD-dependent oxidoreductase [Phycisphaerales bacterium AB-hyl4]|uniref:FAD-dependent oxidoreductase n=1 Tax=Natronomicrosphaera hydrolytica TaxID=3242702 RepID=A0ABV4U723_9BACT